MSLKRAFVALVLVGVASATTLAQSGDTTVGTWKLNVAKSKTTSRAAPRSSSRLETGSRSWWISPRPDGKTRTLTTKGTDGKGQPIDTVSIYEKQ